MHVKLLEYTSGKQRVMGAVRALTGELQIEGEVPSRIVETVTFEHRIWSQRGMNDEAFLRRLPQVFSGAYTRAQFVAKD